MCGRMTLTEKSLARVAEELAAAVREEDSLLYKPRFNIAPTDPHWLVRLGDGGRELIPARWTFGRMGGGAQINARVEGLSLGRRSPLSRALEAHRCVVPADGFYEWTGPKTARRPMWIHRRDGGLLYLAGLYERGPDGKPQFVVITTGPNETMDGIHDRMPAVLSREQAGQWLEHPDLDLLVPAPPQLLVVDPVSTRVNDVKNDDPSCLDKPAAEPPPKARPQLDLF